MPRKKGKVSMNNLITEKLYGKINWVLQEKEKYKSFSTHEEADKWGLKIYEQWGRKYIELMREAGHLRKGLNAVECYCGLMHKQMNECMRNPDSKDAILYSSYIDILTLAICLAPRIPEDIIAYRLVEEEFVQELITDNKMFAATEEKAFMSVSLSKEIAETGESYTERITMLKIYIPKGSKGIYVNSVTSRWESEIVLAPKYVLRMLSYPYFDKESKKRIIECALFSND